MNRQKKSTALLASVMTMVLAIPGGAFADGGRGGDWNHGGKGKREHSSGHYTARYNNHYNNHYSGGYKGYSKGYSKGGTYYYPPYYGCKNCGKKHHHNNNNSNDKLWIGLLGGGILGYTLGNVLQNHGADQGYYPPPPAPAPQRTVTRYETSYASNSCLQEREYRSKIMVGGKQVEGYGTACLQPDGSWRYGPAQPESY